jgi:hypothetical protein
VSSRSVDDVQIKRPRDWCTLRGHDNAHRAAVLTTGRRCSAMFAYFDRGISLLGDLAKPSGHDPVSYSYQWLAATRSPGRARRFSELQPPAHALLGRRWLQDPHGPARRSPEPKPQDRHERFGARTATSYGSAIVAQSSGGGTGSFANIWVDTNGGSCSRQATAGDYTDAKSRLLAAKAATSEVVFSPDSDRPSLSSVCGHRLLRRGLPRLTRDPKEPAATLRSACEAD